MNLNRTGAVTRLAFLCLVAAGMFWVHPVLALGQQPQSVFVPIDQLPAQETIPASRLLLTAYAFVWVALTGFVWSVSRRLRQVEHDLADARRQLRDQRR